MNTNGIYRVTTEDGVLAGMIQPCADHKVTAYGLKNENLGHFATIGEAIAAVHANVAWWTA